MRVKLIGALLACMLLAGGCSSTPDPLKRLAQELAAYPEYSVVLQDMDRHGTFFKTHRHRYKVVYGEKAAGQEELTFKTEVRDWAEVSDKLYKKYQPMLGMVVLSKGENGQVAEANFPPGYQYVGNQRYGHWRSDSRGGSFWEFYGKYALFSQLLGGSRGPLYRSDYDSYRSYRSQGRPYYGPSNTYGTNGSATRASNPSFYQRQQARQQSKSQNFSQKVKSRSRGSSARSRSGSRGK